MHWNLHPSEPCDCTGQDGILKQLAIMPYPDGTFIRWIAPASPGAPSGDPIKEMGVDMTHAAQLSVY
jgi:hypothetical protein